MLRIRDDGSICLTRGDTAFVAVGINNDTSGNPYIFQSGDEVVLSVAKFEGRDPLIQLLSTDGTFEIKPSDTKGLKFGRYVYDVQLNCATGEIYTVVPPSQFVIDGEVTL